MKKLEIRSQKLEEKKLRSQEEHWSFAVFTFTQYN